LAGGSTTSGQRIVRFLSSGDITYGDGQSSDIDMSWATATNDGAITWDDSDDRFIYFDDIFLLSSNELRFRDNENFIRSDSSGQLKINTSVSEFYGSVETGNNITIGSGGIGIDYALKFNGESSKLIMQYDEDGKELVFDQSIRLLGENKTLYGTGSASSLGLESGIFTLRGTEVDFISSSFTPSIDFITSSQSQMIMTIAGVTFNDDSTSTKDFTIETDNRDRMFYVDSGNDAITIGSTSEIGFFGVDGQADEIQAIVQAHTAQNARIFVVEDSTGKDIFWVNKTHIGYNGTLTPECGYTLSFSNDAAGTADQWMNCGEASCTASRGYLMPKAGYIRWFNTGVTINTATSGDVTSRLRKNNSNIAGIDLAFPATDGTGVKHAAEWYGHGQFRFIAGNILHVNMDETGDMAWDETNALVGVCFYG